MPAKNKATTKKTAVNGAPNSQAKPAASNAGSKGKRYSAKEKAKVVDFVNDVNASKGRGGVAAASRKFKVSQLTVGRWVKQAPANAAAPAAATKSTGKVPASRANIDLKGKLEQLNALHAEIEETEQRLARLRTEFDQIKASL